MAASFDTIDHAHLRGFLDQRVTDGVVRRMIDKWLKAGVLDKGVLRRTTGGTPQGGVISPLLSNIYLHYVLDRWFETVVRPRLKGRWQLVRYADDAVIAFEDHAPSDQDPFRRLPVPTPSWAAPGDGRDDVRLPRLHPRVGTVAKGQERRPPDNGEGSLRACVGLRD